MAAEGTNQATETQQAQNTQQQGAQHIGQGSEPEQNTRYAQNLTEQEIAEMQEDMEDIADNTPVRKNDPRTSVQKKEEYRFAANIPGDKTMPEKEYADYTLEYDDEDAVMNGKIPDVLLDVPVVKVDEINFELNDLRAKVNLFAKVLDLVELSVGVDAYLGRVKLVITGVEAQALLKVRLDNVAAILDRVLTTIDRNPQIIEKLVEGVSSAVEDIGSGAGSAVEYIGSGAGDLVGEGLNSAVEDIGSGAGSAVEDIGEGAGSAVEDVGSGAGSAVADIGEGAGSAVEDIGSGAGSAVEDVGSGAGSAVADVGEGAGSAVQDVGEGAGSAVADVGEGAGEAV